MAKVFDEKLETHYVFSSSLKCEIKAGAVFTAESMQKIDRRIDLAIRQNELNRTIGLDLAAAKIAR